MADTNGGSGDNPGRRGRGRKGVIIDLPAEEVGRTPEHQDEPAATDPFAEGPDAQKPVDAAGGDFSEPPAASESPSAWTASAPDEPPRDDGGPAPTPDPAAAGVAEPTAAAAEDPAVVGAAPARRSRTALFAALLVAALLGGAIAAGATMYLAREGFLAVADAPPAPAPPDLTSELAELRSEVEALQQTEPAAPVPPAPDLGPLQNEVAELQRALAELRQQSSAGAAAGPELQEVQSRLTELEQALAATSPAPGPALQARLTELSAAVEELRSAGPAEAGGPALAQMGAEIEEVAGRVAALETRPAPDVSGLEASIEEMRRQLSDLGARLGSMATEQRVAALEANLSSQAASVNEAAARAEQIEALGPAIAAGALAAALEAGAPFANELGALRNLGLDPTRLDALQPFAETGLPTLPELSAEFDRIAESIEVSTPIPQDAGTVGRLLQSARGLVEVRRSAPPEGPEPPAVLARIRGALAAGDLRTALAERQALPEEAQAATAQWAHAAEARAAADELVAQLRTEALARLGGQG